MPLCCRPRHHFETYQTKARQGVERQDGFNSSAPLISGVGLAFIAAGSIGALLDAGVVGQGAMPEPVEPTRTSVIALQNNPIARPAASA